MKDSKQSKQKKQQNTGNRSVSEGIAYQCIATASLVLRMLLYDEYKSVRQNNRSYVDDISAVNPTGSRNYYQCKLSGDLGTGGFSKDAIKKFLADSYKQYQCDKILNENDNSYVLFSKSEPKGLCNIIKALKEDLEPGKTCDEHLKDVLSQTDYDLFEETFEELEQIEELSENTEVELSSISSSNPEIYDKKTTKLFLIKEEYIKFLRKIDCYSRDFKALKDEFYSQLKSQGYPKYTYHIISTNVLYDWLSKDISKETIINTLRELDIPIVSSKERSAAPDSSYPFMIEGGLFSGRFSSKLKDLLDVIHGRISIDQEKLNCVLDVIDNNGNLLWHFFKNLESPNWFPKIKDTLVKSVIGDKFDSAVKYQLLSYFEVCAEKYSDDIIPLLVELENNTKNPNILASIIRTITKLGPSRKENLDQIWALLEKLSEHQHPWVRKEIPDVLRILAKNDLNKSIKILESIFLYTPTPTDVVFGGSILYLTSQGGYNEDLVFGQSVKALSELMADSRFALKAFDLAIKLEMQFVRKERSDPDIVVGIALDHSHIWFADKDAYEDTEYEYDRRVRLALEIEKHLDEIAVSSSGLAKKLFDLLLEIRYEVFYLIVIKVLTRHPNDYLDLIEKAMFDKDLWEIYGIRVHFLQLLIQEYFKQRQDRLSEYVKAVGSYKSDSDDSEAVEFTKQNLLAAIPENLRTIDIKQELSRSETRLNAPARIEKAFYIYSGSCGPEPDIELSELKTKSVDELIKIMEDCSRGNRQCRTHDLSPVFGKLANESPNQLPDLLKKMVNKEIDQDFSGDMLRAYISSQKTTLPDVLNIFWNLGERDRWAKVEVCRYLNQECRKKEISLIDKNVLEEMKRVVFALSSDQDPEQDRITESKNLRPMEALNQGINSIRGIAAEILVALAFYFPEDKSIKTKLIELSDDKTNAVKSTVIHNLRYLIIKDYDLCKLITDKFQEKRDPEIDFVLITGYFSHLGPEKFKANKGFVKQLFRNPNDEIQQNLGRLIGYRYIDGFDVEDLVKSVIKQQRGYVATRLALAFAFESMLVEQIAIGKYQRVIPYFIELLDPNIESEHEVRERTAFIFERNKLETTFFKVLDTEGIFDTVLKDSSSIIVQDHLINYLYKCVLNNESIGRCVEIIHSQVINIEGVLEEPLIVRKLAEILRKVFSISDLEVETKELAEQIFDKGLEKGWDEFYNIFHKRFDS